MTDEAIDVRLARIDERTVAIQSDLHDLKDQIADAAAVNAETFVTQDEFGPIKSVVYGMVGLMLTSLLIALIAVVIRR